MFKKKDMRKPNYTSEKNERCVCSVMIKKDFEDINTEKKRKRFPWSFGLQNLLNYNLSDSD